MDKAVTRSMSVVFSLNFAVNLIV